MSITRGLCLHVKKLFAESAKIKNETVTLICFPFYHINIGHIIAKFYICYPIGAKNIIILIL